MQTPDVKGAYEGQEATHYPLYNNFGDLQTVHNLLEQVEQSEMAQKSTTQMVDVESGTNPVGQLETQVF